MSGHKKQVFVSYHSEDLEFVQDLARKLRDLLPDTDVVYPAGESSADTLRSGINTSQTILAVLPPSSLKSASTKQELNVVDQVQLHTQYHTIPVLLRPCNPTGYISLLKGVDSSQNQDEALTKLIWGITGNRPLAATGQDPGRPPNTVDPGELESTRSENRRFTLKSVQGDEAIGKSPQLEERPQFVSATTRSEPQVFISYRRLDNYTPPDMGPLKGFVDHLLRAIRWRLTEMGVPDANFWVDRSKIEPSDRWSDAIEKALNRADLFVAIISENYLRSSWCIKEACTMKTRASKLPVPPDGRIFRVDRHKVAEERIPPELQELNEIQAVQFYREDLDAKKIDEFFWGGRVRLTDEYDNAIDRLASAIAKRLQELQIQFKPEPQRHQPQVTDTRQNGRVIFVAKPAPDMLENYRRIVAELRGHGFRVVPAPDTNPSDLWDKEEIRSLLRVSALAKAEVSIHLLGDRPGRMNLVSTQLSAAAEKAKTAAKETKRKPRFERLIWAPGVLLVPDKRTPRTPRDPFEVLDQFGQWVNQIRFLAIHMRIFAEMCFDG